MPKPMECGPCKEFESVTHLFFDGIVANQMWAEWGSFLCSYLGFLLSSFQVVVQLKVLAIENCFFSCHVKLMGQQEQYCVEQKNLVES